MEIKLDMNYSLLTPEELDAHIAQGTFRLSFVGMSNAGKSYRSKTLQNDMDFLWYQVDAQIQEALKFETMEAISSWLGYPSDPEYPAREKQYLELENTFTKRAAMDTHGKNLVFDTTGSVIHLDTDTLKVLRENCLVINLDVGEQSLERMVEKFFLEPKPVAWVGNFIQEEGESKEAALRRSYPLLLQKRLKQYRELAHVTIPSQELRDTSGAESISIIKKYLA